MLNLTDDERLLIVEALQRRATAIYRCRTPTAKDAARCEALISKICHGDNDEVHRTRDRVPDVHGTFEGG